MNKFKYAACIAALVFGLQSIHAQNEEDVLRYSQYYNLGTARSQALGGAFGAVGADYSSSFINPAGLGLYRRNEVHLGAAIGYLNNQTTYIGNPAEEGRTYFNIPSFGGVFTKVFTELGKDVTRGLTSVSVAAGMQRVNSFQQNLQFNGTNNSSSISDAFLQRAQGTNFSVLNQSGNSNDPAALAWWQYLIDTLPGSATTYSNVFRSGTGAPQFAQRQFMTSRGAMYDYNVSVGANFSDWLYLGGGLVITQVYRNATVTFTESVNDALLTAPRSLQYTQEINTGGYGVSGRFGVIVRPIDYLRLGFSAQTQTRLSLRDDYQYTLSTSYAPARSGPMDYIEYDVVTPARYTGSLMLMWPEMGFVSADVELVDYASAFISSSYDFSQANTQVRSRYNQAVNIRTGAEIRIADVYRLRAGYSLFDSPIKPATTIRPQSDFIYQQVTGGVGVIVDRFFYDFTAVYGFGKNFHTPYTLNAGTTYTAENKYTQMQFILTAGYRF